MGRISTEAIKPGMVLAEDLRHSNGRCLLGKGVTLEENHRRILKIWGIHLVDVVEDFEDWAPLTTDKIDHATLQAAERLVIRRFPPDNLDNPFFKELLRICARRKAEKMAEQEAHEKELFPSPPETDSELVRPALPEKINPQFLVDREPTLTSLPNVFLEISNVINDPRSSAVHISDVISTDMNLSAKLLRMVNSAFYGFPSKIHTISRAVTIIGTKQLSTLALGACVLKVFKNIPADIVNMESFWRHSIACGVSARMIASYMNIFNTERLFVAGLLHDIGRIIMYTRIPKPAKEALMWATKANILLRTAETEVLGCDHAQIGGMLLRKWKFPLMLEHGVAYHHDPFKSQYPLEASIVCLSDVLANALEMGSSGERLIPPVVPAVWEKTRFEKAALAEIVQLIERQVAEIQYLFFGER